MWVEVALVVTWIVVIPYLVLFPPHRFWRLRAKLKAIREKRRLQGVKVQAPWVDKKSSTVVVPKTTTSVIVFVNPKSGGQLGQQLLANWRQLLHPLQVVDLSSESPDSVLARFSGRNLRLIVCGGDGTVGWVMNAATTAKTLWPLAVLPLGTGNDLARALGWGGGASAQTIAVPSLRSFLDRVLRAPAGKLDRWRVEVTDLQTGAVKTISMNNYVSIGIDAEIGMKFHKERQQHPERFSSQQKNVFKYALYGFEGAFEGEPLGDAVSVFIGSSQTQLEFNPLWKGLVVNNLPCYHGGKDFWGSGEDGEGPGRFSGVDISDGKLEVMGLSGTLHIGLVHVSLDRALRLAQPDEVLLRIERHICIQIDGEPFDHGPCTIKVVAAPSYPILKGSGAQNTYDEQEESFDDFSE
jgi:diacylglycerol kinase (ATP)